MNKITRSTKIGAEFSGQPRAMEEPRVFAFSGGRINSPGFPAKNIHTNLDFAHTVGLPTRAVSATQYEGQLASLMMKLFGENWLRSGKMEVKFIALVDVGDVVTSKAVVTSREKQGGDVLVSLNVWCENQHGNKVLVGTASCIVQ